MFCSCGDNQSVEIVGLCDTNKFVIDTTARAWTEISIPKVLKIPCQKPEIESIEKVLENVKIISKRIVDTPPVTGTVANSEGTNLTGKKLVVEGILEQKIVYTADEPTQSVHSADFSIPFSAFIVVAPLAANQDYCVDTCVEDVFVKALNEREIFKNVTLLLSARIVTVPC